MAKSKKQRRIEIIKDAMLQLKAGTFVSTPGIYVDINNDNLNNQIDLIYQDDAKKHLQDIKPKTCKVCAKGALLVSCVRKENDMTLGDLMDAGSQDAVDRLSQDGLFKEQNLHLIERAYEGWLTNRLSNDEKDEYTPLLRKFFKKYGKGRSKVSSEKRLMAIFRNMLRNDGVFVLK